MSYTITVIAPPISEPVSLDEAKAQLRLEIDFTDDDSYVCGLISIARDRAEKYCNRYFTTQTVALNWLEAMPSKYIEVPFPDVASINSIKYRDGDNVEYTIPAEDYEFVPEQGLIYQLGSWPTNSANYRIEIITGAPAEFNGAKIGMLMAMTDMYELRTESVMGASVAVNPAVKALMYPYRIKLGI